MSLESYKSEEFEIMTARLKSALEILRGDITIPATRDSIIQLAGCSRRLLYTPKRSWVIDELESICKERDSSKTDNDEEIGENPSDGEELISLVDRQNNRIEQLQAQNSEYFHEIHRLKCEIQDLNSELTRLNEQLKKRGGS
ncbi:hypothetical protein [Paraburkholderia nodosa]|uniref:hypothetical protein n=1 Tax=Paraburkholderia nodosa TaxID=392320 RepID=UPI0012B68967|nr:hypothetical protein [Paraburkholderia nodosa]